MNVIAIPNWATDKTPIWSSEDEKVAEVDQNGNVMGKSEGTVKIVASPKCE